MSEQNIPIVESENNQAESDKSISQSDVKSILKISNSLFKEWKYRTKLWWTQYRLIFCLVVILSILPLLKLFFPFSNDIKFSFSWTFPLAGYILAMCSYYFLRMQTQKIEETYATYTSLSKKLLDNYQVSSNNVSAFSKANTLNAGTTLVLSIISISSFWIAGNYNSDSFMSGSLLTIISIIMIISCAAIIGKENHEFVHKILDIVKNIGTYIGKVFSVIGILFGVIIGAIYILIEGVVKGITLAIGVDSDKGMRGAFNRLKKNIDARFAERAEQKEKSKAAEKEKQESSTPVVLIEASSESTNTSETDELPKSDSTTSASENQQEVTKTDESVSEPKSNDDDSDKNAQKSSNAEETSAK